MTVGADGNTGARRRERQVGEPRKKRFYVSFSDTELAVVRTAAEREGMASAAWAGRQVMAVAQHVLVPVSWDAGDVLRELIAARVHLRETVTALRALAAADPPTAGLPVTAAEVAARALDAVARVDEATVAVMRERRSRS
ncbi:hypothetical protein [Streptomyces erythrochromogenes]|uniref:hypothetical protein n=1 Tax=Streptomyces erythrochromogenes TaxID=285574 RepID=UPI0036BD8643